MVEDNKLSVVNGVLWKFLERCGTQGIQFVVQLILAKLLSPNDYGTIGLIIIFIALANVFVQSGFNTALIQKKSVDDLDYSSVLIASLIIALLMYILLFLFAPIIAAFYKTEILIDVIRVLSLTLFFGAINSVQVAKISREFDFKLLFKSSILSIIISGIIGVILAYLKFGVWSLVFQQLISQIIVVITLGYAMNIHIKLKISLSRLKTLFSFGSKMLASSLIDALYNNLYGLVIGKVYSSKALGLYNRADQFPSAIIGNINGALQSVMLPAMSVKQNDKLALKGLLRKTIVISCFCVFPMIFGIFVCAETIVRVLLNDTWLDCIVLIQILCLFYAWMPIHTANLQAMNALGRSDIYLKLEIIKRIIGIFFLIISIPFGVIAMAWTRVLSTVIAAALNCYPTKKLINYTFSEQMKDIFPSFFCSIIMVIIIGCFNCITIDNLFVKLLFQLLVGFFVYLFSSYFFNKDTLFNLIGLLKRVIKKGA